MVMHTLLLVTDTSSVAQSPGEKLSLERKGQRKKVSCDHRESRLLVHRGDNRRVPGSLGMWIY